MSLWGTSGVVALQGFPCSWHWPESLISNYSHVVLNFRVSLLWKPWPYAHVHFQGHINWCFTSILCCVLWEGCSYCNMMCAFPGFSQSTVDFCAVSWSVFLWLQHASFPLPPWQPQQFIRCCIVIVWFAGKWRTLLCIHVLAHHWADFFSGCLLSAEESVCLFPTYITQSNDRHSLFLLP